MEHVEKSIRSTLAIIVCTKYKKDIFQTNNNNKYPKNKTRNSYYVLKTQSKMSMSKKHFVKGIERRCPDISVYDS